MGYVSFRVGMPLSFCFQEKHSQKIAESYSYPSGVCSFSIAFLLFLVGVMLKLKTFSPPNIPAFTKIGKKSRRASLSSGQLGTCELSEATEGEIWQLQRSFWSLWSEVGLAIRWGFFFLFDENSWWQLKWVFFPFSALKKWSSFWLQYFFLIMGWNHQFVLMAEIMHQLMDSFFYCLQKILVKIPGKNPGWFAGFLPSNSIFGDFGDTWDVGRVQAKYW